LHIIGPKDARRTSFRGINHGFAGARGVVNTFSEPDFPGPRKDLILLANCEFILGTQKHRARTRARWWLGDTLEKFQ
jgi:hypothetical protein